MLWQRTRVRPSRATFTLLGVALVGVALVISGGDPASIVDGAVGWGDALVLARRAELRPLQPRRRRVPRPLAAPLHGADRGARLAHDRGGDRRRRSRRARPTCRRADELWSVTPQIAYLAIPGAFIAVLTWNAAVASLGAQNTVLFCNLIPVTTFAIEIARGYRPASSSSPARALTIGALVANNLLARRPTPRTRAGARDDLELAEAA